MSPDAADEAVAAIARGEVVALPTDTVYGLVCDPANPAAVERVYLLKRRPATLELTLLAPDSAALDGLVTWTPTARRLAAQLWPGALSIILPVGPRHLAIPRAGTTVSARVPDDIALRRLLARTGPLASTSANRHGSPAALDAAQVRAEFGAEIAHVLAGGSLGGVASTIIDCSVAPPRVVREGPIDGQRLAALLRD